MRHKIIIENNSPVLIVDNDLFGANLRGSSCQNQLALSKFGIWLDYTINDVSHSDGSTAGKLFWHDYLPAQENGERVQRNACKDKIAGWLINNNRDFKIQGRVGNENVALKVNLRSFSLYRNYFYPLTLSNVGEPSWS